MSVRCGRGCSMTDWSDINSLRAALLDARSKLAFINGMADAAANDMGTLGEPQVARKCFEMIAEKSKREAE